MAKQKVDLPQRDELAESLADSLNKKSDGKVAFFLDGFDTTPTDLDEFVSTGATMLDLAISNRPHGGVPLGRIMELTGLEGSGKSLLSAHLLANVQKMGGVGVLIDTEAAVNAEFFTAVGVDFSSLLYVALEAIEDIFNYIEHVIEHVRKSSKDRPVVIVVDSVAGASTRSEIAGDYSKEGYATDKSIIISRAMRKMTNLLAQQKILLVFTNQLRQKMNAMPFGDQYTTSGGKAIGFHSSVRLRLSQIKKIKAGNNVVGTTVKVDVKKNRIGPPHRTAEFDVLFDRGIDDNASWLKSLKEAKLVKQAGAWYTYGSGDTEVKFQSKDFSEFLEEDLVRKEELYQKVCENYITSYRTTKDVDFTEEESTED
ncbi:MAG: ATPase domain-containing protein [Betaproteobacteria bacterium]|jgi:recombination protein RecA